MDVSFSVWALDEAPARFGRLEIFNTDQGSQLTSAVFTGTLAAADARISMEGVHSGGTTSSSSDHDEPAHLHIERDDRIARFWLDPVRLAGSGGFGRVEIGQIEALTRRHRGDLVEAWPAYFGN